VKVSVAVVGRLKASDGALTGAEAEYLKRLRRQCTFELVEHKDEAALLAALPASAHLYALDERGDQLTSRQLANDVLGAEQLHGGGAPVVFAIGGADGHSDALRARSRRLIAFGRITIAHRLVRVLLLEQLYRAFSILRGEPYHRD
jgi:23S rRNA (pseudouridine1915-N3)-methyltransferase